MVKTKKITHKGERTSYIAGGSKKRPAMHDKQPKAKNKRGMADVHTEVPANKKGDYRQADDWWDDILSGETCRCSSEEKIKSILTRAFREEIGLNVQMYLHNDGKYYCYMTRIMGEEESTPPSKRKKK